MTPMFSDMDLVLYLCLWRAMVKNDRNWENASQLQHEMLSWADSYTGIERKRIFDRLRYWDYLMYMEIV